VGRVCIVVLIWDLGFVIGIVIDFGLGGHDPALVARSARLLSMASPGFDSRTRMRNLAGEEVVPCGYNLCSSSRVS